MNRVQRHTIDATLFALAVLFLNWFIGWWHNGLKSGMFDLKSCWEGAGILLGAGSLAFLRFVVDSGLNSEKGKHPYKEGGE